MQKIITSRFPTKCRSCKQPISAGERVYWFGKGKGVSHLTCQVETPDSPAPKDKSEKQLAFPVKFTELRDRFQQVIEGDFSDFSSLNEPVARKIAGYWDRDSKWIGCTVEEMSNWLINGFTVEGLQGIDSSLLPSKPKRRTRFSEEGDEMLIDLAWSGIDEHWIEVEKRNVKPGLKVEIHLSFNYNFEAKVIVDYQRWIARMLQTFDENAIDVEVDLVSEGIGVYEPRSKEKSNVRVRVKESGEAADFASWSAMFSPGGFRQLTFLGIVMSGDHFKRKVSTSLGSAVYHPSWAVEYNEGDNVLTIRNPGRTNEFPEFEMTQKLQAVIEKVAG